MSSDPMLPRPLQPGPPAVEVLSVCKSYRQYRSAGDRLIEEISFGRIRRHREKRVLDDVSFTAARGECIGILGRNGCGKSTLLGIIAGTIAPSAGLVRRRGRISALLELGTAFYPEASGRENIYQYATAQQISRSEIESRLPAILDYAELGADIDYPLRSYSSGMVARLAFAVACSVEPDLLIVDETLAVGDIAFRHKALSTIQRVRDGGATILFVTHNPAQVIGLADRAFVLEKGKIIADGRPAEVVPVYQRMMLSGRVEAVPVATAEEAAATDVETDLSAGGMRYGTGAGRLLGVALSVGGQRVQSLERGGEVVVRISWRAELPIEHPNVGFLIKNEQGVVVTSANLQMCGLFLPAMRPGEVRTAEFALALPQLECNSYSIHPTLADGLGRDAVYLDSIEHACIFKVTHADETYGILRVPAQVRVQ